MSELSELVKQLSQQVAGDNPELQAKFMESVTQAAEKTVEQRGVSEREQARHAFIQRRMNEMKTESLTPHQLYRLHQEFEGRF